MADNADNESLPFPSSLASGDISELTEDELVDAVWSHTSLEDLAKPFVLPPFNPRFASVSSFVEIELKLQVEMWRSELDLKVNRVRNKPKPKTETQKAEKHLCFPCASNAGASQGLIIRNLNEIEREPPRGQFTNYVVVLQRKTSCGTMENLTMAYIRHMRKKDGALFALGVDYHRLHSVPVGTTIYVRCLKNASLAKTHLQAIAALKEAEAALDGSYVTRQLLAGHINKQDIHSVEDLDKWIKPTMSDTSRSVNLHTFNEQQQRALALEALTPKGVVLIQGPPGTGKSHTICHGMLPQAVARDEKVLLVCNSNVAVDALMIKCTKIDSLRGRMLRCGFKSNVSDEIVEMGLYAEGSTLSGAFDQWGNLSGSNSNTGDANVQSQIRSSQVVFTTIHFASKAKGKSTSASDMYWNFDILMLDEAAQIEDSRLFIVLARCPSLKKVVLVGDPKQIQPYVPESLRRQNYGQSTMERLMGCGPSGYVMLEEQFRMAPLLRKLVSYLYYEDRLKDVPNVACRGPSANLNLKSLLAINLTGTKMTFSRLHQSYENKSEAQVCKFIYEFLFSSEFDGVLSELESGLTTRDVCILTPFNRHKDQLRMKVCNVDEDTLDVYSGQTFGGAGGGSLGSPTQGSPTKGQSLYGTKEEPPEDLVAMAESIDTVDKFQGSERKVVMISTCVDQKPLRAGDPHFINVACSRAQHLLVVVGNFSDALTKNQDWLYVWNKAKKVGSCIEHRITEIDPETDDAIDIHEEELKSKLRELLQGPTKRAKIG